MSPERIQIFNCSAAEGQRFQEEVIKVSKIIENLGSNPTKESLSKSNDDKSAPRGKKKKSPEKNES